LHEIAVAQLKRVCACTDPDTGEDEPSLSPAALRVVNKSQGALVKIKASPAADQHEVGAPVMVIEFAPDAADANDFTLTHHLATGRRGRPALVTLHESEFPDLQAAVAKDMHALALAQVEALDARFPNDEYLSKLQFLQPSFYQFDLFDTRETIVTKAQQANKEVLHADLAALITKYAQPKTVRKRDGCASEVAPLLPPLVLDATGVDAGLMLEIAAVLAVVSEWPIIPERIVDRVGV
jgi:hypothetical protein